ncbi:hypothetical protein HanPI659440_Chr01g0013831 [Helianthus annuus]|nr:hypothetical protein HanPI659440_Chr01g0013831 [Helianthus annuus]
MRLPLIISFPYFPTPTSPIKPGTIPLRNHTSNTRRNVAGEEPRRNLVSSPEPPIITTSTENGTTSPCRSPLPNRTHHHNSATLFVSLRTLVGTTENRPERIKVVGEPSPETNLAGDRRRRPEPRRRRQPAG